MGDASRCGAERSFGRGLCRKFGLCKPDGTWTKRCKFYNGGAELLEPGDPKRGGRPVEHGFYSETLREEQKSIYAWAMQELGTLDHELALARTNLHGYQTRMRDQEKGGIPSSVAAGGQSVTIHSYADIVAEYLNLISRLEFRRARILESIGGTESNDTDLLGHEEWLKSTRDRGSKRPPSRRSR